VVFKEIKGGAVELKLGARPAAQAYAGKEVTLGIRPENCDLVPQGKSPSENSFQALVDIVEPMGAETYFYLQTGAHTVISRSHALVDQREAGHRLRFEMQAERAHLFDPGTGLRIH
jgi:multiple sugar transport system ATP-binding protein